MSGAALQRVTVWHSLHSDVTSEDEFTNINMGRWAGYLHLPFPMEAFKGKVFVLEDDHIEDEYDSIASAAAGIGWQLEEGSQGCVRGLFNTENSSGGKRHVFRIDADMEATATPIPDYHTREELEALLNTGFTTVRNEMHEAINAKVEVIRGGVSAEIDGDVTAAKSDMEALMVEKDNQIKANVITEVDSRTVCGKWMVGQYTLNQGASSNILEHQPMSTNWGHPDVEYNATHKTMRLRTGPSNRGRMVRVVVHCALTLVDDFNGIVFMHLKDSTGATVAQAEKYLVRQRGMPTRLQWTQFTVDHYIDQNSKVDPFLVDGLRVVFSRTDHNGPAVRIETGSWLWYSITE